MIKSDGRVNRIVLKPKPYEKEKAFIKRCIKFLYTESLRYRFSKTGQKPILDYDTARMKAKELWDKAKDTNKGWRSPVRRDENNETADVSTCF